MHIHHQKQCRYCGQFFCPDRRTINSETGQSCQKACGRSECREKRKREARKKWLEANPDAFRNRYINVKTWLETHPGYLKAWRARRRDIQDEIHRETPVKIMRLAVPVGLLGDIQDEIRLVRRCGCGFYVAGERAHPG